MPKQPACGNAPAFSTDDWSEIHDALILAHDALGAGHGDVDRDRLRDCCGNLRIALKRVHKVMGVAA